MQEQSNRLDWRRPFWFALLVSASVAFSFGFACAAPIAAFAAFVACTLSRRDAYGLIGAVWLASQAIGFGFLHYPLTPACLTWGAAIGLASFLSTGAARQALPWLDGFPFLARNATVFLVAFLTNQTILFALSLGLGGIENYTAAIQARILGLNLLALIGLLAMNGVGQVIGIIAPVSLGRREEILVEADGRIEGV